jgi:glutathione S-transferase
MSNSIVIHSFPLSGHSHRVILFASLAGIAHEVINVDLAAGEQKQEAFLSLNPDGQVPVIKDGDVVVTDSNAILVYLSRKYAPSFLPTDFKLEAEVQKFLTMAAGEIAFGVAAARLINVFNAPLDAEFCQQTGNSALNKLETHLEGREFLVGDQLSIADVAIYSYIAHAPEGGISLEPYPNVRRLLTTIEGQQGFVAMPATQVGLAA